MNDNLKKYVELRHNMRVIPDDAGYNRQAGMMNPHILDDFARTIKTQYPACLALPLWEPFAGNLDGKSLTKKILGDYGFRVLCYGMDKRDTDLEMADSTVSGPRVGSIGGVIFHPPYFGSKPFTDFLEDLSNEQDYDTYQERLENTVAKIKEATIHNGLICAVCRRYRYEGEEVALDLMYLQLFDKGFELVDVWNSSPDIVLIFRREV